MNPRLLTKAKTGEMGKPLLYVPPRPLRSSSRHLEAPAWLVSLCIHVSLILILAIAFRPFLRGTGGQDPFVLGVAFVQEVSEGNENEAAAGGASENPEGGGTASAAILSAQAVAGQGPPMDVGNLLSDLVGSDSNATPSADSLGGVGNSVGSGTGGGQQGGKKGGKLSEVNFYDVAGVGNSFVYVIDRSDSMNVPGMAPLRAAKREVSKSLEGIKPMNQFQIVFYNEQPFPYPSKISGSRGLIRAQDAERKQAIEFVKNVSAFGGTEHLPALKLGISMGPDVLFFLTDAEQPGLNSAELESLVERCEARTTIHTIEFGNGPNPAKGRWIEALAERTGGKYRYVDVTQLE